MDFQECKQSCGPENEVQGNRSHLPIGCALEEIGRQDLEEKGFAWLSLVPAGLKGTEQAGDLESYLLVSGSSRPPGMQAELGISKWRVRGTGHR